MTADQKVVPIYLGILERMGLTLAPGAKVLDFGAGLGRHVREFIAAGFDCWGIDIQTENIAAALAAYDKDVSRIRLYDAMNRAPMPFESASFDLIVSASTMEHVLDYEWAISEMARTLKPSGVSIHFFPARWMVEKRPETVTSSLL